jgi:hypothetical protein
MPSPAVPPWTIRRCWRYSSIRGEGDCAGVSGPPPGHSRSCPRWSRKGAGGYGKGDGAPRRGPVVVIAVKPYDPNSTSSGQPAWP